MTRWRNIRFFWLGLVVPGAVAGAQETLMIPSDRDASAQVASIVASAKAAGLPTEPIISKVAYGVALRHARPDAIVSAATSVAARLEQARDALAPNPTPPDI